MIKKKEEIKSETQEIKPTSAPKFSIEKLRENSKKLFGIPQSTFDGAASGLNGEYTVQEMKDIISKWLKKEAK